VVIVHLQHSVWLVVVTAAAAAAAAAAAIATAAGAVLCQAPGLRLGNSAAPMLCLSKIAHMGRSTALTPCTALQSPLGISAARQQLTPHHRQYIGGLPGLDDIRMCLSHTYNSIGTGVMCLFPIKAGCMHKSNHINIFLFPKINIFYFHK
jgi:hypothetical protein